MHLLSMQKCKHCGLPSSFTTCSYHLRTHRGSDDLINSCIETAYMEVSTLHQYLLLVNLKKKNNNNESTKVLNPRGNCMKFHPVYHTSSFIAYTIWQTVSVHQCNMTTERAVMLKLWGIKVWSYNCTVQ